MWAGKPRKCLQRGPTRRWLSAWPTPVGVGHALSQRLLLAGKLLHGSKSRLCGSSAWIHGSRIPACPSGVYISICVRLLFAGYATVRDRANENKRWRPVIVLMITSGLAAMLYSAPNQRYISRQPLPVDLSQNVYLIRTNIALTIWRRIV